MEFHIAPNQIDELLVKEQLASESLMILRVKKPDFIGDSMWDFVHDGRVLTAQLADSSWLNEFRQGSHPLTPGDSLRTLVKSTVRYGFDNDVVNTRYEIIKVLGISHQERPPQLLLSQ